MPDSVSTLEETGARISPDSPDSPDAAQTDDSADGRLPSAAEEGDLLEDSLVEEVSIDGMCGVY